MRTMINLMPPTEKEAILFARHNSRVIRWLLGVLIAAVGVVIVAGGGLFYLKQDSKFYQKNISEIQTNLEAQNEQETLAQVQNISDNFSLVVDVLSRQVLFSKLLQHLGSIMPDGTILRNLTLSDKLDGGIDLQIGAKDYQSASQALVNIQDSNSLLFTGADAKTINCEGGEEEAPYVCTASIRTLLVGDNPFLLLNQGAKDE